MSRAGASGVTLIELMIALVIVAMLVSIAVPSYRTYSQRAHRTEAKSALLRIQTQQERHYLQNNEYADTLAELGIPSGESEHGVYTLSLATTGGWTLDYTATAVPKAGGGDNGVDQSGDTDCASFSIDSEGVRSASSAGCW